MALGIVLTPYGKIPGSFPAAITQARGGNGTFLEPADPYFNSRGEAGYYYDTQLGRARKPSWWQRFKARRALRELGDHPNDFEIGSMYNYTPVMSGWINTNQGFVVPPPWNPTPPAGFAGLRDSAPATVDDVVAQMNAHNDRVFSLTLVSTAAVAVSAMITVFRTLKLIKDDKH